MILMWSIASVTLLWPLHLASLIFVVFVHSTSTQAEAVNCVQGQKDWPTLTVYKPYFKKGYHFSTSDKSLYRAIRVTSGTLHNSSWDVSAPNLIPILKDRKYQSLLCEYGAILAVGSDAEKWANHERQSNLSLIPSKWVGFEGWHAKKKRAKSSSEAILHLEKRLQSLEIPEDAVVYWGKHFHSDSLQVFCGKSHGENCPAVFSQALKILFAGNETIDTVTATADVKLEIFQNFLPDVPSVKPGLCYFSSFAMTWQNLIEYTRFGRAFFVALESLFNVHYDEDRCPIDTLGASKKHCWCFIMERLINIWMYHSGKPIYVLDNIHGSLSIPYLSFEERNSLQIFERDTVRNMINNFSSRLVGSSLYLYENL